MVKQNNIPVYTFLLTYKVVDRNYVVIASGQMRCKNQVDAKSAEAKLKEILKKKYPTADRIKFTAPARNETLEQQGEDIIALIRRNKAKLVRK